MDNDKEFASHQELAESTGMKVYFCEPYSPWQRGTNENTNGLLRQFFPKGTSFADISDDDLQNIVELINNRLFIEAKEQKTADTEQFIGAVKKYTKITELTQKIMHEFIEKIAVHAPYKSSGHRTQVIEIHWRFNIAVTTTVADSRE
ncbi:MAG: IS30 family transposase [Oscillospiraceae bacterium]